MAQTTGGRSCPPAPRSPRRARSRRTGSRRRCRARATTGRYQRCGLWVGCEAEELAGVHRRHPTAATELSGAHLGAAEHSAHGRHPMARGRLLARRRVPAGERSPVEELEATPRGHRRPASSTPSPTSTPTARASAAAAADVSLPVRRRARSASRSSSRSPAGRTPRRRSCSRTQVADVRPARWSSGSSATAGANRSARRSRRSSAASTSASTSSTACATTRGSTAGPPAARRAARRRRSPAGSSHRTGGDGGGSIRIPAGFNGLVGMKGTAGRIPRGPHTLIGPMTVVIGCLARSVRDVCPLVRRRATATTAATRTSLPRVDGWERDLGTHDLRGKRVAIAPTLGVADRPRRGAGAGRRRRPRRSPADAGLEIVDVDVHAARRSASTWALANLSGLLRRPRRPVARRARTT